MNAQPGLNMPAAYAALEARFRRIRAVRDAGGMLHWDLSVMMPPGGAAARAEQLATLQVVGHAMLTDPAVVILRTASARSGVGMNSPGPLNMLRSA